MNLFQNLNNLSVFKKNEDEDEDTRDIPWSGGTLPPLDPNPTSDDEE